MEVDTSVTLNSGLVFVYVSVCLCVHSQGTRKGMRRGIVAKKKKKTTIEHRIGHRSRIPCHLILDLLTISFGGRGRRDPCCL